MKTKLFTLLLAIMANIGTMLADSYKVDGLYYIIKGDQAYVTYSYGGSTTQPINYGWNITTANIPTTITIYSGTYSVVGIGDYAFEGCSSLTSVTIPNSIIGISDVAFLYCNKLLYVTIDSDYLLKKMISHGLHHVSSADKYKNTYSAIASQPLEMVRSIIVQI